MNKKAEAHKFLEFLPRIVFLVIAFLIVGLYISFFKVSHVRTFEIEQELLLNRLYFSPDLITYTDLDTGRTYPGVIDLDKVRTSVLENSLKYTQDNYIAAKITIQDASFDEITYKDPLPRKAIAYLNEAGYIRWEDQAILGWKGRGAYRFFQRRIPIEYVDNGVKKPGFMLVNIIKANY